MTLAERVRALPVRGTLEVRAGVTYFRRNPSTPPPMPSPLRATALDYLRRSLGDPATDFRDGQWEAIEALVARRERLLVVQRTGWGKSVVYFIATRLLRDGGAGPTLIVSPLLALMRNQIEAAGRIGIHAVTINSANTDEWPAVEARLRQNAVDVLLISPERLANADFRTRVLAHVASRVGLFVVEEAHCISDWGHDFRPDYLRLKRILEALPRNLPVLATTATANDRVVEDVQAQLGASVAPVRGPLVRRSLRLQTLDLPSPAARMAWLAEHLPGLPGSGIVYALTTRDADRVAAWLRQRGIAAEPYHASVGATNEETARLREERERALLEGRLKALVATVALGMGFDHPQLGFVVHYQRPGSVVHYYQQIGRAGRAVDEAFGVLMSGQEDDEIADFFIRSAFPPEGHVADVLAALDEADGGLTVVGLERAVNLGRGRIEHVLKYLDAQDASPVRKEGTRWYATPIRYAPDRAKVERITQIRYDEQAAMRAYAAGPPCLMAYLCEQLDDPAAAPCGRCAACLGRPVVPASYTPALAAEAAAFLRRAEIVIEPRRQWMGWDPIADVEVA